MLTNLENSAVATGLEKVCFSLVPKKGNARECSNYHTIVLISHTSKVMLKILQARQLLGQRSLVGYSLWAHKELDMTEQLTLSLSGINSM